MKAFYCKMNTYISSPIACRTTRSVRNLSNRKKIIERFVDKKRRTLDTTIIAHSMFQSGASASAIAASTSLDNLTVGIALGLSGRQVPAWLNFQIATANAGVMALGMLGGSVVGSQVPEWVSQDLPGILFLLLGAAATSDFLFPLLRPNLSNLDSKANYQSRQFEDSDSQEQISILDQVDFSSLRATIPLTFGMCINNLGGGVAAGLAQMSVPLVSTFVCTFSLGFFGSGYIGGNFVRSAATRFQLRTSYVNLIAGLILIQLGLSNLLA